MLKVGQPAPVFVLPDADMESVRLSSFKNKRNIILFFYPRDNAPACVLEAADFSDHEDEFLKYNCLVFGISRDDCLKHAEFRDKHGISVRLLSDEEGSVCKKYGVWQAKETEGEQRFCILRSTFLIDEHGVLQAALYGVNAKGHALEMLRLLKELKK